MLKQNEVRYWLILKANFVAGKPFVIKVENKVY